MKSVFLVNNKGQVITSSFNSEESEKEYASLVHDVVGKVRESLLTIDPDDSLTFVRIRTQKAELMIAPERTEGKYMLIVIQDPTESS